MGFLKEYLYPSYDFLVADDWSQQQAADELPSILVDFVLVYLMALVPQLALMLLLALLNPGRPGEHIAGGGLYNSNNKLVLPQASSPVLMRFGGNSALEQAKKEWRESLQQRILRQVEKYAPVLIWPNLGLWVVLFYCCGIAKACGAVLGAGYEDAGGLVNLAVWTLFFLIVFLVHELHRTIQFYRRHLDECWEESLPTVEAVRRDPAIRLLIRLGVTKDPLRVRGEYRPPKRPPLPREPKIPIDPSLPLKLRLKEHLADVYYEWLDRRTEHAESPRASYNGLGGSWLVRTSGATLIKGALYNHIRLHLQILSGFFAGALWFHPDSNALMPPLLVLQLLLAIYCLGVAHAADRLEGLCCGFEALLSSLACAFHYLPNHHLPNHTTYPTGQWLALAALLVPVTFIVYDVLLRPLLIKYLKHREEAAKNRKPSKSAVRRAQSSARIAAIDDALEAAGRPRKSSSLGTSSKPSVQPGRPAPTRNSKADAEGAGGKSKAKRISDARSGSSLKDVKHSPDKDTAKATNVANPPAADAMADAAGAEGTTATRTKTPTRQAPAELPSPTKSALAVERAIDFSSGTKPPAPAPAALAPAVAFAPTPVGRERQQLKLVPLATLSPDTRATLPLSGEPARSTPYIAAPIARVPPTRAPKVKPPAAPEASAVAAASLASQVSDCQQKVAAAAQARAEAAAEKNKPIVRRGATGTRFNWSGASGQAQQPQKGGSSEVDLSAPRTWD